MEKFDTISRVKIIQSSANGNKAPFIQPKLSISNPDDQYEREADAMADKVMRMENPGIQLKPLCISSVQRKCAECEEEEKKPVQRKQVDQECSLDWSQSAKGFSEFNLSHYNDFVQRKCTDCEDEEKEQLQRKEINKTESSDNVLENYVGSLPGSGQPLPTEMRKFYEPRFGYDFSGVKIHTDAIAAKSAQSINALAYTSGHSIVFNNGQYSPYTDAGKHLLAHELTHIIQQGGDANKLQNKTAGRMISRMAITPVGTPPASKCGSYSYKWKFELDKPAACDGFMVQKVNIHEVKKGCSEEAVDYSEVKPKETFWECWQIKKGDKLDVDFASYGYTDNFSEGEKPNSTGTHSDVGYLKFFCDDKTGDLNKLWTPNKYSGGLPATTSKPSWWDDSSIDNGYHFANSWWSCCGEKKPKRNDSDSFPK